jgi:exonuclease VII large subunit
MALLQRTARLGSDALAVCEREEARVVTWQRLLTAYDVDRQLERGYTITFGPDGRVVRGAAELVPGAALVTRFADGEATSTVDSVETRSMSGESTRDRRSDRSNLRAPDNSP